MMPLQSHQLIGRAREQAELRTALERAASGEGGIVLLAGEAGIGKTRLADECLALSGLTTYRAQAREGGSAPYAPLIAVLRAFLRRHPDGLAAAGPLAAYLGMLLPELGPPPADGDAGTLCEAVCLGLKALAAPRPAAVLIDDLQWADSATLELLPALAGALDHEALLVLGTYRNDELARAHPLRRTRSELRRMRRLRELTLEPLDERASSALAAAVLGVPPSAGLGELIYAHSEGVPFFIEELTRTLADSGRLRLGPREAELLPGERVPVPETVRDAVLLQLDGLSAPARAQLEAAAVLGAQVDLDLLAELQGGTEGIDELFERGLLIEGAGGAAFRHALARDAILHDLPWAQRRVLHRQVAGLLENAGAPPELVAGHWRAGREPARARDAFLAAARRSYALYAYHDAAAAWTSALELWPDNHDVEARLDALEQLGRCAQRSGRLSEAARAWREAADARRKEGQHQLLGEIERQLALVYELQGSWERSLEARTAAADAFVAAGLPGEAAVERLAAAAHERSAGRFRAALELLARARTDASAAGRRDLLARIAGLEGNVRTRMGHAEGVLETRAALATALDENLAGAAAEIYQRLADSLEHAGDYAASRDAYLEAFGYCEHHDQAVVGRVCQACLAVVLRQIGEWQRAITLCREVLQSPHSLAHARCAAGSTLGTLYALRGEARLARPILADTLALARSIELLAAELLTMWGLAVVEAYGGDQQAALAHCRALLQRWQTVEEQHFAIPALRWASSCFAAAGAEHDVRACVDALATIATHSGLPEALSALAHAFGELALLNGDYTRGAEQFGYAVELLRGVDVPFCRALTQYRAGAALAACGRHAEAAELLQAAQRNARALGARPLATSAAAASSTLDAPLQSAPEHGRRPEVYAELTRRQLEVLRLIAQGRTTAQIAGDLVLSPRTVEMHVANILAALDSRSRAEAVRKAAELGMFS